MGDLIAQQPHLGRESIALLGRIVDSPADGLAQDDIEPSLLVRLLRCGYVCRREPDVSVYVATPAGVERSRLETIAARRRQDDLDRQEIIRGRLQAMITRLELDDPDARPVPKLRDFGLPEIHQRELPATCEPSPPSAIRGAESRPAHRGGSRASRDARLSESREGEPRATPEDALSLIRESEQETIRERRLALVEAGELSVEHRPMVAHVGRLPPKREAGLPVQHEHDLPADLGPAQHDEPTDPCTSHDEDPQYDGQSQSSMTGESGDGWRRAAVVAAVAVAALLVGDPVFRHLSLSVTPPVRHVPAKTATLLPSADVAARNSVPRPSAAAKVHVAAGQVPPPAAPAATEHTSGAVAARAPAPDTIPGVTEAATVTHTPAVMPAIASPPVVSTQPAETSPAVTTTSVVPPARVVALPDVAGSPLTIAAARTRASTRRDNAAVDRLNLLSLRAAQHGQTFSPHRR